MGIAQNRYWKGAWEIGYLLTFELPEVSASMIEEKHITILMSLKAFANQPSFSTYTGRQTQYGDITISLRRIFLVCGKLCSAFRTQSCLLATGSIAFDRVLDVKFYELKR